MRIRCDWLRYSRICSTMPRNTPEVWRPETRSGCTVAREGDSAVVTVKDVGVGIAPEMLPRIFEMFNQGGRSSGRRSGDRIVVGEDGWWKCMEEVLKPAARELGKGATFTVRLPISKSSEFRNLGNSQKAPCSHRRLPRLKTPNSGGGRQSGCR